MPVYHFTFHAYLSWLPDRPEGYVRRDEGVLDRDVDMSWTYAQNAKFDGVILSEEYQHLLIEEAITASRFQDFRLHGAATDPSHVHLLVSWKTQKSWEKVRRQIKTSLSCRLNAVRETTAASDRQSGPSIVNQVRVWREMLVDNRSSNARTSPI